MLSLLLCCCVVVHSCICAAVAGVGYILFIGIMFNEESMKQTFRNELDRQSAGSTEFKIDPWDKEVDVTDSVNVSKTSQYIQHTFVQNISHRAHTHTHTYCTPSVFHTLIMATDLPF
jgi:hypothetical protein